MTRPRAGKPDLPPGAVPLRLGAFKAWAYVAAGAKGTPPIAAAEGIHRPTAAGWVHAAAAAGLVAWDPPRRNTLRPLMRPVQITTNPPTERPEP